ncbi:MAG: HAMP domain-containing sensor histidine kinase, partial [bacterium]
LMQLGKLGDVTPQQKDALAVMERGAKRLSRLIEKMRNFARIKSGSIKLHIEPVVVREVFNQIVEIFAYLIQESDLKISLDGSVKEVIADRDCMESIFKNLIGNALRHTPKGGSVRVTVEEDARFWYFHFFNSGSFIPENLRERIFEEYVTFDEAMGGTGLGLTIVKSFVEAHRGNILVNSDELGTTFSFTIKKRAPRVASVAIV